MHIAKAISSSTGKRPFFPLIPLKQAFRILKHDAHHVCRPVPLRIIQAFAVNDNFTAPIAAGYKRQYPNDGFTQSGLARAVTAYHAHKIALIDGKYLLSASKNLLINTCIDALAHAAESRVSIQTNIYNQMFANYALKLWGDIVPFLRSDEELSEELAEKLMLTSTIAGMAIAQTGTSIPHALSYDVTYHNGVAHGKACGIFLAAYLRVYAEQKPEDVEEILTLLGFKTLDDFASYLTEILGTVSLTQKEVTFYIDRMMENTSKLATCPFELTREDIEKIYRESIVVE